MLQTAILCWTILLAVNQAVFAATPTITAVGSKFFTSDGDQFYIKGIAYQLVSTDPLVDTEQCKRDAKQMQDLGANAIRVYHVDPAGDHRGCMDAFADAGIYLFVDLDDFPTQIQPDSPAWNPSQLAAFSAVMDEFQKYDNTALFFVGNEVLTTEEVSNAAPYVKAAVRDMKAYRDSKNYRKIPIGYSAADVPGLRPMLQNYLSCGPSDADRAEFYSLNVYEWCGDSGYELSGYSQLQKNASGYNVPLFVSETGCRISKPRLFTDQAAILGPEMSDTWSGAIVYEWIQEANDYGLISYGTMVDPKVSTDALDGYPRSGTPTTVSPDYGNLKSQWATLIPTGVKLSTYSASASITPPACPTSTPGGWIVNGNAPLPSLGQTLDSAATASGATPTSTGSATKASTSATGGGTVSEPGKEVTAPADGAKPFNYVEQPPAGEPQRNFGDTSHDVTINDLRGKESTFNLNTHAFAAIGDVPSKATRETFEDDEAIKRIYYPEVESLLLRETGAKKILFFDHTIRLATPGATRAPVNRVHIDQTALSAAQRVRFHLPPSEAEEALKSRYRIINVWRPLNPPIVAHPLAFADSTSVPDEAMVGIEHRYPDRTGETAAVRWTEGQRWWYWSGMEQGERLLLQCSDSDERGGARVPHSAFVDPRSGDEGRESIEVRALVFG
ncbi:MAG: hypothetical protein Q9166_005235 [cf. Caloplaca sp. 2 TL-2023]